MFVYKRVCEEYLYTSVVRRGCVQGPDTYCYRRQTDRQMQHCSNSVTILKNWFNKVMSFCLRFVKNIILTVNRLNSKQVKQNWTCLSCSTFRNHALNF